MSKAWKHSKSSRVLGNFSLVSDQSLICLPRGCQAATAAPGALGWPQSHAVIVWITEDKPCWDQGRLESGELVWPGNSQHACVIVRNEMSPRCAWYSAPRPFWNQGGILCVVFTAASSSGSPTRLQDRRRPAGGSLQQEINPVDLGASGVSNCSWVDLGSKDRREFDAYTIRKWKIVEYFVHLHSFYLSSTLEMKPEKNTLGDRPAYTIPGEWNRKDGIREDSLQGGGWWGEAGR